MNYYMFSVWKKNGKRIHSQCCSTSERKADLDNARLCRIRDDEMYVISQIESGHPEFGGGEVSISWFYDNHHAKFRPEDDVIWKINAAISKTLEKQFNECPMSKFSADELVQEAECFEECGGYLRVQLMGYSPKKLRDFAKYLQEREEQSRSEQKYYKASDGWFDFYVNTKTGEKKFKLDDGDILVEREQDDFTR